MPPPFAADRVRPCLLAGAVGDAWGGPFEGRRPHPDPAFPSSPALSDDTLLTLATCEAISDNNGRIDPETLAERFRAWFEAGRLVGLGSSTFKSLRDLSRGAHWALSGARGEFAAGAGAAMRCAPIAFVLDPSKSATRSTIRDVCRITHHNDEAYTGALAIIGSIRICASGLGVPGDLLMHVADELPDTAVRERLVTLDELNGAPCEIAARLGTSGHVVDAVPLAMYVATREPDSVEAAIRLAVSLGGDTDTIASLVGQFVAAGGAAVPEPFTRDLVGQHDTGSIIDRFTAVVVRSTAL